MEAAASGLCVSPSRPSPSLWISTWVDYTTKYGLGYLLNNGCVGVYFNDSTKIILGSEGERFEYYERTSSGEGSDGLPASSHTLTTFPPELNKKVTLLKHFRAYLVRKGLLPAPCRYGGFHQ